MTTTLCFGGSFNPVHHGHLICARAAAEAAGFGRVALIPSANPPHKPASGDLAAAHHRLRMCQLAVQSVGFFDVDDVELQRAGPSYTIETARELRRRGQADVAWLVGADMLLYLPKWHEAAALVAEVRFVVMARPGWAFDWPAMPAAFRHLEHAVVTVPQLQIGATDIRRRLAAGQPIDYLTPPAVIDYIRTHGLYGAKRTAHEGTRRKNTN